MWLRFRCKGGRKGEVVLKMGERLMRRWCWCVGVYVSLCGVVEAAPPVAQERQAASAVVVQDVMGMFWFRRQAVSAKPSAVPKAIRSRLMLPFVDPAIPKDGGRDTKPATTQPPKSKGSSVRSFAVSRPVADRRAVSRAAVGRPVADRRAVGRAAVGRAAVGRPVGPSTRPLRSQGARVKESYPASKPKPSAR